MKKQSSQKLTMMTIGEKNMLNIQPLKKNDERDAMNECDKHFKAIYQYDGKDNEDER